MSLPRNAPVIAAMQTRIQRWEDASDQKALFLRCYLLMTNNVLAAVDQQEFNDSAWVDRLLHRFADYYFVALEAYERIPASAPPVWQRAHDATLDPDVATLQKLLLGINAHINYDLVLTLADLLRPEWHQLTDGQRAMRYADHCRINDVIGNTIDVVQDQVIDPVAPFMDIIDKLMGPVDEKLMSHVITRWRERVWQSAALLVATDDPHEQEQLVQRVEHDALRIGDFICSRELRRETRSDRAPTASGERR